MNESWTSHVKSDTWKIHHLYQVTHIKDSFSVDSHLCRKLISGVRMNESQTNQVKSHIWKVLICVETWYQGSTWMSHERLMSSHTYERISSVWHLDLTWLVHFTHTKHSCHAGAWHSVLHDPFHVWDTLLHDPPREWDTVLHDTPHKWDTVLHDPLHPMRHMNGWWMGWNGWCKTVSHSWVRHSVAHRVMQDSVSLMMGWHMRHMSEMTHETHEWMVGFVTHAWPPHEWDTVLHDSFHHMRHMNGWWMGWNGWCKTCLTHEGSHATECRTHEIGDARQCLTHEGMTHCDTWVRHWHNETHEWMMGCVTNSCVACKLSCLASPLHMTWLRDPFMC